MAVRIRLKRMGRTHRPFFRVCAMDGRNPRDGRVIEELGYYDPMVKETDARARLNGERIDYWIGVGAQPSDNVRVLIKKYGTNGTHLDQQSAALERLNIKPQAPEAVEIKLPEPEAPAPEPAAEPAAKASSEEAKAEEAPAEEAAAPEKAASDDSSGDAAGEEAASE